MERCSVAEISQSVQLLICLLGFLTCIGSSGVVSRTLDPDPGSRDFAIELDASSFNSSLWAAPARWAIVEFYAHWCPACRNYKPQYERVARLFNGPDAIHPGLVFMAKVDCALKVNAPLCDRFKIGHYPTLLWASPSNFAASGDHGSWEAIENGRKAEMLLQFVNSKIGKTFSLDDAITYDNHLLKGDELDFGQVAISNFDIEEATAKAMDIIMMDKLLNRKTRSSFIQLLQLLVVHHPSRNCRKGTADLLMNLEDLLWPSIPRQGDEKSKEADADGIIQEPDYKALESFHVCGDHIPRGYWVFCRGSQNDTRGYSCGLWLLFHAVAVRVDNQLASSTFRTICSFVDHFFTCKECREHFLEFCSSARTKVTSRRQLVLWLWNVHNVVNERVGKEETTVGVGDPKFVKQLWPPAALCKSCWKEGVVKQANSTSQELFSFSEVYSFLLKFYGHALAPSNSTFPNILVRERSGAGLSKLQESSSGSAVTVPVGAALAIALASCGFGAVACFWRTRQKKRKQVRRRV